MRGKIQLQQILDANRSEENTIVPFVESLVPILPLLFYSSDFLVKEFSKEFPKEFPSHDKNIFKDWLKLTTETESVLIYGLRQAIETDNTYFIKKSSIRFKEPATEIFNALVAKLYSIHHLNLEFIEESMEEQYDFFCNGKSLVPFIENTIEYIGKNIDLLKEMSEKFSEYLETPYIDRITRDSELHYTDLIEPSGPYIEEAIASKSYISLSR
jgi:hypothetical protein